MNKETEISIPKIRNLLLLFSLPLNKKTIPNPAFTNKPAKIAPNDIVFRIYNSAKITDDEQLGIKPTNVANKGEKYLLDSKNISKLFAPIK